MIPIDKHWKKLFLFCLGLSFGVGFCMKWIEDDFWVKGEKFKMMGLELFYSKEKVIAILSNLDDQARSALNNHLHFDFAFMAGIFPGATSLCMMARTKIASASWKKFFFILASLQLAAWAGDITENLYLLKWAKQPIIGDEFALYRFIVTAKWIIGLLSVVFAVPVLITRLKKA
jgi:hypothetical protein